MDRAIVNRRLAEEPVAIVGMSGIFPQARDLREFWNNIVTGVDCLTEVPPTRWRRDDHYDPDPLALDKSHVDRGAFLPKMVFDPREFGLSHETVLSTGLVQLLSLIAARDVLTDAGCDDATWYDPSRTGVTLGAVGGNSLMIPLAARLTTPVIKEAVLSCGLTPADAEAIADKYIKAFAGWTEHSLTGVLGNVIAGRVANRLDLGATHCTIDASGASSMAALRMAVEELTAHRADLMITGGCDADNTLLAYMCFGTAAELSRSGQVRPFDAAADGTLLGEGIGMLALRRLADAERDGNRVYAVLRGLGSAGDGRTTNLAAPHGEGQLSALRKAYADADCSPTSVELIEAHGTGVPAADQVELTALHHLLSDVKTAPRHTAVGSITSQIGHTKAAAGAAGIIKAALALHDKVLPPTINVTRPIDPAASPDSPLYLNTRMRPWVKNPHNPVRRAAVSSFGIGGVNFHAVLEEHHSSTDSPRILPAPRAYLWHAPTPEALARLLEHAAEPCEGGPIPADDARVGFVAASDTEYCQLREVAATQMRADLMKEAWDHPRGISYRRRSLPANTKVAALFADQGSQYVDMGLHAAISLPPVRAALDTANALDIGAIPLSRVMYPLPETDDSAHERNEELLRRTEHAQPAIGALAMGQYRYLSELGYVPDGALGHSFGELAALWAAGCFDNTAFLRLARARGESMAPPHIPGHNAGAMAVVHADPGRVEVLASTFSDLIICGRNAPDETVIGGPAGSIVRFLETCREQQITALRLPAAAAFHTPNVTQAVDAFGKVLAGVDFAPLRIPVYANTSGAGYGKNTKANRRTLTRQLVEPVDFAGRVQEMYANGYRVFVEFGPRQALSDLVHRILHGQEAVIVPTDKGPGTDSSRTIKEAAVRLAVLGLPIEDINRYNPAAPEKPEHSEHAIELTGPNFATDACQQAYRAALANGYRIVVPAKPATSQPSPVLPNPSPILSPSAPEVGEPAATVGAARTGELPAVPAAPVGSGLARIMADHLELHTRYLDNQLRTAEALTEVIRRGTEIPLDAGIVAGIDAVKDHSLALGQAHIRATEVFADLARLDPGRQQVVNALTGGSPQERPMFVEVPSTPGTSVFEPDPRTEQNKTTEAPRPEPVIVDIPDPVPPVVPAQPVVVEAPAQQVTSPAVESVMRPVTPPPPPAAQRVATEAQPAVTEAQPPERTARTIPEPVFSMPVSLDVDRSREVASPPPPPPPPPAVQPPLPIPPPRPQQAAPLAYTDQFAVPDEPEPVDVGAGRDLSAYCDQILAGEVPNLVVPGGHVPIGQVFLAPCQLPRIDARISPWTDAPGALLMDDGSELIGSLATALESRGWQVTLLSLPGIGPRVGTHTWLRLDGWGEEHLANQIAQVTAARHHLDLCVLPVVFDDMDSTEATCRLVHTVMVAKHLRAPLQRAAARGRRAAWVAVTRLDGALGLRGSVADPTRALAGGVAGLVRTLAFETPDVFCRYVDIAPTVPSTGAAEHVLAEVEDAASDLTEVGYDGRVRTGVALVAAPSTPAGAGDISAMRELSGKDLLVVTGGGRGITAACVVALAQRYGCGFVLLGRTPLGARRAEGAEVEGTLARLRGLGVSATYLAVDVTDACAVREALAPYAGRVSGVIHGAGVYADQLLEGKTSEEVIQIIGTKIVGLTEVLDCLPVDNLRHLVLFSSMASVFGTIGQADLALSSDALNRFAVAWKAKYPACRTQSIAWGPWEDGKSATGGKSLFTALGATPLSQREGAERFVAQFGADHDQDVVTLIGPTAGFLHRRGTIGAGGITAERQVGHLIDEPVLAAHRVDGDPALPLSAAIGWCVNVFERAHGEPVREIHDFRVAKGLTFDGSHPERLRVLLHPGQSESGIAVSVAVNAADLVPASSALARRVPWYEGRLLAGTTMPVPSPIEPPEPWTGDLKPEPTTVYDRGLIPHGPLLRGVWRVFEQTPRRYVFACRLADATLARGAFAGRYYSPVLSDVVIQSAQVAGRLFTGVMCLPLSVERVELFEPLPDDDWFLVTAELASEGALDVVFTVTATGRDGAVRQRWTGLKVGMVVPGIAAKGERSASGQAQPQNGRTASVTSGRGMR